jgi:hypothetical protein
MNKLFTHKAFTYLKITFLVAVFACGTMALKPATVNTLNFPSDIQVKTIKCYPNPAIAFINFDIPGEYLPKGYSLQVFSFTGKKMYEMSINAAKLTLNFNNDFYRGIYIYQARDAAGKIIETGKFQVNK